MTLTLTATDRKSGLACLNWASYDVVAATAAVDFIGWRSGDRGSDCDGGGDSDGDSDGSSDGRLTAALAARWLLGWLAQVLSFLQAALELSLFSSAWQRGSGTRTIRRIVNSWFSVARWFAACSKEKQRTTKENSKKKYELKTVVAFPKHFRIRLRSQLESGN